MQAKPLSGIEQAVNNFVRFDCAINWGVHYTGKQTRDEWECDGWRFAIKDQSFEYFTGMGHRVDSEASKRARIALKNVSRRSIAWVNGVENAMLPAIPPIAGVLHSLLLDSGASGQSFADWCDDFGYDSDSRKALSTYEACQRGGDKLRKVFTAVQIETLRDMLQDY